LLGVLKLEETKPRSSAIGLLSECVGKKIRIIVKDNFGYEGVLSAVSDSPPSLFLSDADAVVVRTTIADPVPRVVSKERRSSIFVNLDAILRIEIPDH
jgi:small nuclear ribonucleoprotein (snRNP)-like protein